MFVFVNAARPWQPGILTCEFAGRCLANLASWARSVRAFAISKTYSD